ncbi:YpdA family putative bacillithiol disulfide reductase [Desertivirga arenae]|uniref:YpdA family putative bacillithiol disulfide reductase n=1 Tax=Desertivirga arenae TaxID=2810309 RepID=UPI001A966CE5|nr:YpdA family putative bacillithiol disulfide reductase [Pedobacter sp. SYSU D00823]
MLSKNVTLDFDLLIIGGGPIGLACAIEAKKAGLSYLILEKGTLVNSLYNYPVNMTFFSTSERLEIGGLPFPSINPKPTRAEALEYYRRAALQYQLNIKLFEPVETVSKQAETFVVTSTRASYTSRYIVVATGFYDVPNYIDVPGEKLEKVYHYYKDPHFFTMQKVAVIGASNSSVDVALETFRKGAEVTMIIRGDTIGKSVKYWVRPDIENRIKEGSITAYFNSEITEIREREIDIITPEGPLTIENDFVLAMTGYLPNFDFLNNIGIECTVDENRIPIYSNSMETNIKNLYLAGVVCGGMNTHTLFIENSRIHAVKIIEDIMSKVKK